MPIQIEQDGATVEVYTQAELDAQKAAAAEEAIKNLPAPAPSNNDLAQARRAAEKRLETERAKALEEKTALEAKLAETEAAQTAKIAELEAQLSETTGKTAAELEEIRKQLAAETDAKAQTSQELESTRTEHAMDLKLITLKVDPAKLGKVKALLATDQVDLSDDKAVETALDTLREDAPGLFSDRPTTYRGSTGSHNPPKRSGGYTMQEAEQMTQAEYEAARKDGSLIGF